MKNDEIESREEDEDKNSAVVHTSGTLSPVTLTAGANRSVTMLTVSTVITSSFDINHMSVQRTLTASLSTADLVSSPIINILSSRKRYVEISSSAAHTATQSMYGPFISRTRSTAFSTSATASKSYRSLLKSAVSAVSIVSRTSHSHIMIQGTPGPVIIAPSTTTDSTIFTSSVSQLVQNPKFSTSRMVSDNSKFISVGNSGNSEPRESTTSKNDKEGASNKMLHSLHIPTPSQPNEPSSMFSMSKVYLAQDPTVTVSMSNLLIKETTEPSYFVKSKPVTSLQNIKVSLQSSLPAPVDMVMPLHTNLLPTVILTSSISPTVSVSTTNVFSGETHSEDRTESSKIRSETESSDESETVSNGSSTESNLSTSNSKESTVIKNGSSPIASTSLVDSPTVVDEMDYSSRTKTAAFFQMTTLGSSQPTALLPLIHPTSVSQFVLKPTAYVAATNPYHKDKEVGSSEDVEESNDGEGVSRKMSSNDASIVASSSSNMSKATLMTTEWAVLPTTTLQESSTSVDLSDSEYFGTDFLYAPSTFVYVDTTSQPGTYLSTTIETSVHQLALKPTVSRKIVPVFSIASDTSSQVYTIVQTLYPSSDPSTAGIDRTKPVSFPTTSSKTEEAILRVQQSLTPMKNELLHPTVSAAYGVKKLSSSKEEQWKSSSGGPDLHSRSIETVLPTMQPTGKYTFTRNPSSVSVNLHKTAISQSVITTMVLSSGTNCLLTSCDIKSSDVFPSGTTFSSIQRPLKPTVMLPDRESILPSEVHSMSASPKSSKSENKLSLPSTMNTAPVKIMATFPHRNSMSSIVAYEVVPISSFHLNTILQSDANTFAPNELNKTVNYFVATSSLKPTSSTVQSFSNSNTQAPQDIVTMATSTSAIVSTNTFWQDIRSTVIRASPYTTDIIPTPTPCTHCTSQFSTVNSLLTTVSVISRTSHSHTMIQGTPGPVIIAPSTTTDSTIFTSSVSQLVQNTTLSTSRVVSDNSEFISVSNSGNSGSRESTTSKNDKESASNKMLHSLHFPTPSQPNVLPSVFSMSKVYLAQDPTVTVSLLIEETIETTEPSYFVKSKPVTSLQNIKVSLQSSLPAPVDVVMPLHTNLLPTVILTSSLNPTVSVGPTNVFSGETDSEDRTESSKIRSETESSISSENVSIQSDGSSKESNLRTSESTIVKNGSSPIASTSLVDSPIVVDEMDYSSHTKTTAFFPTSAPGSSQPTALLPLIHPTSVSQFVLKPTAYVAATNPYHKDKEAGSGEDLEESNDGESVDRTMSSSNLNDASIVASSSSKATLMNTKWAVLSTTTLQESSTSVNFSDSEYFGTDFLYAPSTFVYVDTTSQPGVYLSTTIEPSVHQLALKPTASGKIVPIVSDMSSQAYTIVQTLYPSSDPITAGIERTKPVSFPTTSSKTEEAILRVQQSPSPMKNELLHPTVSAAYGVEEMDYETGEESTDNNSDANESSDENEQISSSKEEQWKSSSGGPDLHSRSIETVLPTMQPTGEYTFTGGPSSVSVNLHKTAILQSVITTMVLSSGTNCLLTSCNIKSSDVFPSGTTFSSIQRPLKSTVILTDQESILPSEVHSMSTSPKSSKTENKLSLPSTMNTTPVQIMATFPHRNSMSSIGTYEVVPISSFHLNTVLQSDANTFSPNLFTKTMNGFVAASSLKPTSSTIQTSSTNIIAHSNRSRSSTQAPQDIVTMAASTSAIVSTNTFWQDIRSTLIRASPYTTDIIPTPTPCTHCTSQFSTVNSLLTTVSVISRTSHSHTMIQGTPRPVIIAPSTTTDSTIFTSSVSQLVQNTAFSTSKMVGEFISVSNSGNSKSRESTTSKNDKESANTKMPHSLHIPTPSQPNVLSSVFSMSKVYLAQDPTVTVSMSNLSIKETIETTEPSYFVKSKPVTSLQNIKVSLQSSLPARVDMVMPLHTNLLPTVILTSSINPTVSVRPTNVFSGETDSKDRTESSKSRSETESSISSENVSFQSDGSSKESNLRTSNSNGNSPIASTSLDVSPIVVDEMDYSSRTKTTAFFQTFALESSQPTSLLSSIHPTSVSQFVLKPTAYVAATNPYHKDKEVGSGEDAEDSNDEEGVGRKMSSSNLNDASTLASSSSIMSKATLMSTKWAVLPTTTLQESSTSVDLSDSEYFGTDFLYAPSTFVYVDTTSQPGTYLSTTIETSVHQLALKPTVSRKIVPVFSIASDTSSQAYTIVQTLYPSSDPSTAGIDRTKPVSFPTTSSKTGEAILRVQQSPTPIKNELLHPTVSAAYGVEEMDYETGEESIDNNSDADESNEQLSSSKEEQWKSSSGGPDLLSRSIEAVLPTMQPTGKYTLPRRPLSVSVNLHKTAISQSVISSMVLSSGTNCPLTSCDIKSSDIFPSSTIFSSIQRPLKPTVTLPDRESILPSEVHSMNTSPRSSKTENKLSLPSTMNTTPVQIMATFPHRNSMSSIVTYEVVPISSFHLNTVLQSDANTFSPNALTKTMDYFVATSSLKPTSSTIQSSSISILAHLSRSNTQAPQDIVTMAASTSAIVSTNTFWQDIRSTLIRASPYTTDSIPTPTPCTHCTSQFSTVNSLLTSSVQSVVMQTSLQLHVSSSITQFPSAPLPSLSVHLPHKNTEIPQSSILPQFCEAIQFEDFSLPRAKVGETTLGNCSVGSFSGKSYICILHQSIS